MYGELLQEWAALSISHKHIKFQLKKTATKLTFEIIHLHETFTFAVSQSDDHDIISKNVNQDVISNLIKVIGIVLMVIWQTSEKILFQSKNDYEKTMMNW